jgi:hypothetical protein
MKAALGDLYTPWFGTRELLLHGKNPYAPEVTHEIQMAFYGHDVIPANASGAKSIDEQRFAYPVFLVFLLAPTIGTGFDTLQAAAPAVLALAVAGSVWFWLSFLGWPRSTITAWAALLFILASPEIAQGLRLRQLGLIVAFLFALGTWLVGRNYLVLAGAVFALSAFKPQMVVLPLSWFVLWSIGDLPKRWRLPASFSVALALLVAAGELILPGWPRDFIAGLVAYRRYGPVTTLLQLPLGNRLGVAVAAVLVAGLLVWGWGWNNRKRGADSPEFMLTLSAFLIVAALALPLMTPFNQVLLVLPVLVVVRDWAKLHVAARIVFAVWVSWPWIASLVLLAWPPNLKSLHPVPLLPSAIVLFLPFLLPILLMAGRAPIPASTPDV